jgi:hypothetical protein
MSQARTSRSVLFLLLVGSHLCSSPAPPHGGKSSSVASAYLRTGPSLVCPLVTNPNPLSLGPLDSGQDAKSAVSLRNEISKPVTVERVESTCSCIKVSPLPIRLEARRTQLLLVKFDPSESANFNGAPSVRLTGFTADGYAAFVS